MLLQILSGLRPCLATRASGPPATALRPARFSEFASVLWPVHLWKRHRGVARGDEELGAVAIGMHNERSALIANIALQDTPHGAYSRASGLISPCDCLPGAPGSHHACSRMRSGKTGSPRQCRQFEPRKITGRATGADDLEPLAVSPRQARLLLGVGNTRLIS